MSATKLCIDHYLYKPTRTALIALRKNKERKEIGLQEIKKSIYVITTGSCTPTKIGVSQDCAARLKSLQTSCWLRLVLLDEIPCEIRKAHQIEWVFHQQFLNDRLHGEWYDMDARFVAEMIREATKT